MWKNNLPTKGGETIMINILQISACTKRLPNGNDIDQIHGLADDGKMYLWDWKTGEWKLNAKAIEPEM